MSLRHNLLSTSLLAGTLLLTGVAVAQQSPAQPQAPAQVQGTPPTPTPSPGMSGTAQPGTSDRAVPAPGMAQPAQPGVGTIPERQAAPRPGVMPTSPAPGATASSGFMRELAGVHYLASRLDGADVYTTGGDAKIADVEDFIFTDRGEVVGVVLAYGGLAGIAQSYVAVEPSALRLIRVSDTETRVETTLTSEQLQAAPKFSYSARRR